MATLHIHNGDVVRALVESIGIEGEHLVWRESLVTGPILAHLDSSAWLDLRAAHLGDAYGADRSTCRRDLAHQEAVLDRADEYDELVLWFEGDLFCQTILLYLMARLAAVNLQRARICAVPAALDPAMAAVRLGASAPELLLQEHMERKPVERDHLEAARDAWRAYASDNAEALQSQVAPLHEVLPVMSAAMAAHLARFPSTTNGLGAVAGAILGLIAGGAGTVAEVMGGFDRVAPIYGFGDAQILGEIRGMAAGPHPLLRVATPDGAPADAAHPTVGHIRVSIESAGLDVLEGRADAMELNGADQWLGGVHLSGGNTPWRWDPATTHLTAA